MTWKHGVGPCPITWIGWQKNRKASEWMPFYVSLNESVDRKGYGKVFPKDMYFTSTDVEF